VRRTALAALLVVALAVGGGCAGLLDDGSDIRLVNAARESPTNVTLSVYHEGTLVENGSYTVGQVHLEGVVRSGRTYSVHVSAGNLSEQFSWDASRHVVYVRLFPDRIEVDWPAA
jgi:hypothetical protein